MSIRNFVKYRFLDFMELVRNKKGNIEGRLFLKYKDFTIISNNCWGDGFIGIMDISTHLQQ